MWHRLFEDCTGRCRGSWRLGLRALPHCHLNGVLSGETRESRDDLRLPSCDVFEDDVDPEADGSRWPQLPNLPSTRAARVERHVRLVFGWSLHSKG